MNEFLDPNKAWRKCEVAWMGWLSKPDVQVIPLTEASSTLVGRNAPTILVNGHKVRAPDFQVIKLGRDVEYWEVKFRTRETVDITTGIKEFWMNLDSFKHYLYLDQQNDVNVALFLLAPDRKRGQWFSLGISRIRDAGRTGTAFDNLGNEMPVWYWPVDSMDKVDGPPVNLGVQIPIFPDDDLESEPNTQEIIKLERVFRRQPRRDEHDSSKGEVLDDTPSSKYIDAFTSDPRAGLDVLSRKLNLPRLPLYSVLAIGIKESELEDLFGLVDYGIRLFVIANFNLEDVKGRERPEIEALRETRLIEWSNLESQPLHKQYIVDGIDIEGRLGVLAQADNKPGGINSKQYQIVHAPVGQNIQVTAGAGTGKTETMTERIMFLLSMSGSQAFTDDMAQLKLSEIVMLTFTKDAAAEMRARIVRTLLVRLRLCKLPIHPVLPWLMQLSSTRIATIHSFAKDLVANGGDSIGFTKDVRVGNLTLESRKLFEQELSNQLPRLFEENSNYPSMYLWMDWVQTIWQKFESNGISVDDVVSGKIQWGKPDHQKSVKVNSVLESVLSGFARNIRTLNLSQNAISVNQLVPTAIESIDASAGKIQIRHLFVDEFQDTDSLQMKMMLKLVAKTQASLFIVGDAKQAIYRFRGAEGDAFGELKNITRGQIEVVEHNLVTNFRTDGKLLSSMEKHFDFWARNQLINYSHQKDRLIPQALVRDRGEKITFANLSRNQKPEDLVHSAIEKWRIEEGITEIAVICRSNYQTIQIRDSLKAKGLNCEILTGGDFFQNRSVKEFWVLVSALVSPYDKRWTSQLMETQWFVPLVIKEAPLHLSGEGIANWPSAPAHFPSWAKRIEQFRGKPLSNLDDLDFLGKRLECLRNQTQHWSVLDLLSMLRDHYRPEQIATDLGSESQSPEIRKSDSVRYLRELDHLTSLLEERYSNSALTLIDLAQWLELQIATNFNEDMPVDKDLLQGKLIALTAHKAKGLEFESVIIPFTGDRFKIDGTNSQVLKNRMSFHKTSDSKIQFAWKWKPDDTYEFENTNSSNRIAWSEDNTETRKEEARLLYVALTRAKKKLMVIRTSDIPSANLNTWRDLLNGH